MQGYYYFGAARELPGVRELFDKTGHDDGKKTRSGFWKLFFVVFFQVFLVIFLLTTTSSSSG